MGGGSPSAPPNRFAGVLGQSRGSQTGMLRQLQRSYGNSYVGNVIQAKLTVNQPGDIYEQEADRMAAQVMAMPQSGSIQREIDPKKEKEKIQMMPSLQRASDGNLEAGGNLEGRLNSSKGGGSPLPDDVRSFMEPRFGADFSQVRVHTGSESVQMNRDLNAQAFTHRQDVYFGAGKAPAKDALTAHELTHVVQQTGGVQAQNIDSALPQSPSVDTSSTTHGLNDGIKTILPNIGLTHLSGEIPHLIQRDPTTPAPAAGVNIPSPSPPPPGSPTADAPPTNTKTDDGLVYITIPLLPLHPGFHKNLKPIEKEVQTTLARIPVPEFGVTLDLELFLSFGVNLEATLNPIVMENVTFGMTKLTAAVVRTASLLGPGPLIAALGLGYFIGYGDLIGSGKVGASAYFSVGLKGGAYAGGLKTLDVATTKIGLEGSVSAELFGTVLNRTLIVLDNGHLSFKQGNKMEVTPALKASLSGYIETSLLFGLIKGRLSKTWDYDKQWPYKWEPEGSLDLDYDNLGFKDKDKVFVLDIDKLKSIANKTGKVVDFLEKLMKDGEKPAEVKEEEEERDNLLDNRTVDDKRVDLNKALDDSESLLTTPDTTPQDILAQLPTIKSTYRLTTIKLVADNDEYYIEAVVNPPGRTKSHKLKPDRLRGKRRDLGNHVHKFAELLSKEGLLTPSLPNTKLIPEHPFLGKHYIYGRTIRADRLDLNNHVIYEIKPSHKHDEGQKQVNYYVDRANKELGGSPWRGEVVTYIQEDAYDYFVKVGKMD